MAIKLALKEFGCFRRDIDGRRDFFQGMALGNQLQHIRLKSKSARQLVPPRA